LPSESLKNDSFRKVNKKTWFLPGGKYDHLVNVGYKSETLR
jgi:hypothetical protein